MRWVRTFDLPPLPPRPRDGHKGTFGRVLVVGGHPDMLGAPVLAGTAAYRVGAGYVQIAVDRRLLPAALSVTPEIVGLALDASSNEALERAARQADCLVLGCGMGTSGASWRHLRRLLRLNRPTVLDADALNLLAASKRGELPSSGTPRRSSVRLPDACVLTPHPGEMARLARWLGLGEAEAQTHPARRRLALAASAATGRVVVLKGAFTVVTTPPPEARVYVEPSANPALAKAGTGDVLAGIIGGFIAQGLSAFDAAVLGVHTHARAGRLAADTIGGRSTLARDVVAAIAPTLQQLESMQRPRSER